MNLLSSLNAVDNLKDCGLNCTQQGLKNLSLLIREALDRHNMSAADLLRACAKIRHKTAEKQVLRLLNAQYTLYPPPDLIFAISILKIVEHPDGTAWSFEDLMLVLCELIDPFDKGEKKPGIAYLRLAIAIILEIRGERTIKKFADDCKIPLQRMQEILTGAVPDLIEILKISSQSDDQDGNRLAGYYLSYMQEQNKAAQRSQTQQMQQHKPQQRLSAKDKG